MRLSEQKITIPLVVGSLFLLFLTSFAKEETPKKEKKQKILTEEIVVVAPLPKDIPLSTPSLIKREKIETTSSRDLSEIVSYTSGTLVSAGSKNESRLKIRGLGSQRITLLYDGIPIYEPFFNSFDLKTITAEEIENIKVIKGASSVLYGPNALGGIINIITRRPSSPSFSLKTSYDSNKTTLVSSTAALSWRNIFFSGFASFEKSDGFKWKKNGENVPRANSDYEKKNLTGKIYLYPVKNSELLLEAAYYSSQFGIPIATEYYRPRFWRFKNWHRFQINLGGTFSIFNAGHIKLRSYYVRHNNVLDAFTDKEMKELQWESTYDNDSYGMFVISSLPYSSRNELKISFNLRNDKVRTQDDIGKGWVEFNHQTISVGVENHFSLNQKWRLIGGVSFDRLKKHTGVIQSTFNPILGLKFSPQDYVDLHLSFSQKSRFPSMRSLYSTRAGNPELRDEKGINYEFGFNYKRNFNLNGALFYNQIKDLITVVRRPEGFNTNLNIGKAEIFGFECGLEKSFTTISFSLNYTYTKGDNKQENRPLDLLPKSQFNFFLDATFTYHLKLSLWGIGVSGSEIKIDNDIIKIPSYFVLNCILSKRLSDFTIFIKAENLLNRYYITEPGYPMKGRTISIGLKFSAGQIRDK